MDIVAVLLIYLVFAWMMGRLIDSVLEKLLAEKPDSDVQRKIDTVRVISEKSIYKDDVAFGEGNDAKSTHAPKLASKGLWSTKL